MGIKAVLLSRIERESLLFKNSEKISTLYHKYRHILNYMMRRSKIRKYFTNAKVVKIHFGCGDNDLHGFLNTDLFARVPVDITKKLPFPSESVDLIYTNHVVEHIYKYQFVRFLQETCRILKKGGIQIIATPSLEKLFKLAYARSRAADKKKLLAYKEREMGIRLDTATFLNREMHVNYRHKFLYDFEAIQNVALMSGFARVRKIENNRLPDPVISEHLKSKSEIWNWETETFVLEK